MPFDFNLSGMRNYGITSPFRPPFNHPIDRGGLNRAYGSFSYKYNDSYQMLFGYRPLKGERNEYPASDKSISLDEISKQYADAAINSYLKNNSSDLRMYQDPTYLGFRLMFDWENSPLLLGLRDSDTYRVKKENNYDVELFKFDLDSAAGYLERTNQEKLGYLVQFGKRLQFINSYMPWYWQNIDGLERAYQSYQGFDDPYRGGDDAIITIETLENVEFALSGMMEMYSRAAFDYDYTRELLPDNLQKFTVYVFVQDIRKFRENSKNFESNRPIRPDTTYYLFKFMGCELKPEQDSKIFSQVGNVLPESASSSFTFSYHDVLVTAQYPWIQYNIDERKSYLFEKIEGEETPEQNRRYGWNIQGDNDTSTQPFDSTWKGAIKTRLKDISQSTLGYIKSLPGMVGRSVLEYYAGMGLGYVQGLINKNIANVLGNVYNPNVFDYIRDPAGAITDVIIDKVNSALGLNENLLSGEPHVPLAGESRGANHKRISTTDIVKPNDTESYERISGENMFGETRITPRERSSNIFGDRPVPLENLKSEDILGDPNVSTDRSSGKNIDIKIPNSTESYRLSENLNVYKFNS